jgi:hypothetical protein
MDGAQIIARRLAEIAESLDRVSAELQTLTSFLLKQETPHEQ